uniref:Uncharacterized protein LOC114327736 n=1 Tax=Diabrotica virgifera virgifera TaxID=50390 RepID=A0A6P7FG74_DIAVI
MKLLFAFLAILGGTALADCGCLKCSKHLTVAGEVPGAPGQAPVKVIYRCVSGYPSIGGHQGGYPACQPRVEIPDRPEVPSPICGGEFPVLIQPFCKPVCVDHHRGHGHYPQGHYYPYRHSHAGSCYMDGAMACYPQDDYYEDDEGYKIVPVRVEQPCHTSPQPCPTLPCLSTKLDRVVVPCPCPSVHPHHSHHGHHPHHQERVIPTCCGHISCPVINPHVRYVSKISFPTLQNVTDPLGQPHSRNKRELPILQNGYKFMMNMLPKFIKEPIIKTVNSMAMTHPDPRLRNMYNLPPPKLTLKEHLAQKHKENMDAIKNKVFGSATLKQVPKQFADHKRISKKYVNEDRYINKYSGEEKYLKKYNRPRIYVDNQLVDRETENFVESLQKPQISYKNDHSRYQYHYSESDEDQYILKHRPPGRKQEVNSGKKWMSEVSSYEVLDEFSNYQSKSGMSEKEKARFLLKLKKLNRGQKRAKTHDNTIDDTKMENHRTKRSIIIDSDALSLPLYQIRLKESFESNEIDDYSDYDYQENSEEDDIVGGRRNSIHDSREEIIRKAIREELEKYNNIKSESESEVDYENLMIPHKKKKWVSEYPLLNILTFPAKVLKNLKEEELNPLPIVGAVPRMMVDTKRYFKDFGKNLKKGFLHFTSDMIGDFDHYGPVDHFLDSIVERKRFKRSLDTKVVADDNVMNPCKDTNFPKESENKVRKKRYILKMVDDDEVEELLREKLGKLMEKPERTAKPTRKFKLKHNHLDNSKEQRKIVEHLYDDIKKQASDIVRKRKKGGKAKDTKKSHNDSMEELKKKIVIEPIKPKVIIDNNGLPFMEINGYKRPIFLKKGKNVAGVQNSIENSSVDPYNSSEEANLQKINSVILRARNKKDSVSPEIPLEAVKEKISQLLGDIDMLVYMDCTKFDQIYDDLIEIQSIKTSIVQSWKRIIMDKKINDFEDKISLLEKFTELQQVKNTATKTIIYTLYEERENPFAVKKLTGSLTGLQKVQCIINQVVDSFQEKFKTGSRFDVATEIKYVDYLASLRFVQAKTRNEMVKILNNERDLALQENIRLLEKLKMVLVEDDKIIEEEASILWEMKHVYRMQVQTIEEMAERLEKDMKIKKCLKILFDLQKRLKILVEKEKKISCSTSKETSSESEESEESKESDEDSSKESSEQLKSNKSFDIEEFKKKWQKKIEKHKITIESNFKKKMNKLKELTKKKDESVEDE